MTNDWMIKIEKTEGEKKKIKYNNNQIMNHEKKKKNSTLEALFPFKNKWTSTNVELDVGKWYSKHRKFAVGICIIKCTRQFNLEK